LARGMPGSHTPTRAELEIIAVQQLYSRRSSTDDRGVELQGTSRFSRRRGPAPWRHHGAVQRYRVCLEPVRRGYVRLPSNRLPPKLLKRASAVFIGPISVWFVSKHQGQRQRHYPPPTVSALTTKPTCLCPTHTTSYLFDSPGEQLQLSDSSSRTSRCAEIVLCTGAALGFWC